MAQNEKSGAIKWLLIIVAAGLLVFICWKAGWILNSNKNEISEQEKQEAIQKVVEEVNEGLHEIQDEFSDALK